MYCEKCGYQIEDNCNFCNHCGNQIHPVINKGSVQPNNAFISPNNTVGVNPPVKKVSSHVESKKTKEKSNIGLVIASITIAVLLVVATIGLFLWGTGNKKTVNLNDYISVKYLGTNTQGTAELEFDYDRFEGNTEQALSQVVYAELDKKDGLSNGDVINLTWQCNDDYAKELGYTLDYSTIAYTVEGLEDKSEIITETAVAQKTEMGRTEALPTPTPEAEADPFENISEGWKLEWDADHPSLNTFTNYEFFNEPIQYFNNRMVVGKDYACWNGANNTFSVYMFNRRNVLTSVRFLYFGYDDASTRELAESTGGYIRNNVVYVDEDSRVTIGQTTKQAVVDFHCQGTSPIFADGYTGSDLR